MSASTPQVPPCQIAFNLSVRNEACVQVLWKVSVCGVRGTADWFGVSKDGDATQKWQRKSLRHCSLRYGKLKPQVIREMDLPSQDNISLTSTETPPPLYVPSSQYGMQKVKWVALLKCYSYLNPFLMKICHAHGGKSCALTLKKRNKLETDVLEYITGTSTWHTGALWTDTLLSLSLSLELNVLNVLNVSW